MQPGVVSSLARSGRSWWANALLWALSAGVLAPLAFTLSVGLVALIRGAGVMALGAMLYIGAFAFIASFMFALLPYATLLLGWGAIAPRVRIGERSKAELVLLAALLALPAGLTGLGWPDEVEWQRGVWIWGAAWIGLALPRLTIRRLGPDAFRRASSITPAT